MLTKEMRAETGRQKHDKIEKVERRNTNTPTNQSGTAGSMSNVPNKVQTIPIRASAANEIIPVQVTI